MNSDLQGTDLDLIDPQPANRPDSVANEDAGDLALEDRIAAIWAAELNLPAVAPDDDFFAIGGDSLGGVRLFLAVEKAFGKPLPESALANITTVRDMVRRIEAAGSAPPERPAENAEGRLTETERRALATVMAMGSFAVARPGSAMKAVNTGGSRTPLFWCFNSPEKEMGGLAPHLDPQQPFYGLYSGGRLFPKTEASMSGIAEFYAGEIVSLFPDGPYAIGGNCRGAKVAVKIAAILEASGRKVEKLCFLEYSNTRLYDFDGQVLMMFGTQSRHRAYRAIRWGAPGWRESFRQAPVAAWVSGAHGQLFQPYNVPTLARKLDRFLGERPRSSSPFGKARSSMILTMHKIPVLFYIYRMAFKLRDRVFYGKSIRVNPFTGEPMT